MPSPSVILIGAIFWLAFACGSQRYQLREAIHQSHQNLQQLLGADQPDRAGVIAAFERANRNLDAASGPYLILWVGMLFLLVHLVAVKRRLAAAERTLQALRDVVLGVDGVSLR